MDKTLLIVGIVLVVLTLIILVVSNWVVDKNEKKIYKKNNKRYTK